MTEQQESIGRIEVAPDVLMTIVRHAVLDLRGVRKMAPVPSDVGNLFRRSLHRDGIVLDFNDEELTFDIYVLMDPDVNILETSRALQSAVIEAIDKMVGIPVAAVNIHVEDVLYAQGQTA